MSPTLLPLLETPFPSSGVPCLHFIWGFVSCLIINCGAIFIWYPRMPAIFWREIEKQLGERECWGKLGEVEEGKTAVGIYYMGELKNASI